MIVKCHYCERPVDTTSRYTWHRVQGWERKGAAGGSDIAMREPHDVMAFAHPECVDLERSGIGVRQEALL